MKRNGLVLALACAAIALLPGCPSCVVELKAPARPAPPRVEAYADRWIGSGACPPIGARIAAANGAWEVVPLFGSTDPAGARRASATPAYLGSLCALTWHPARRGAEPAAADAPAGIASLSQDAPIVASLEPLAFDAPVPALTRDEGLWEVLAAKAEAQWGVPRRPPSAAAPATGAPIVRVAIVDNRWGGADKRYPHGAVMERVIRELACASSAPSPCLVEVRQYVGLPLRGRGEADFEYGGYIGSRSQVGDAIQQAVDDWERDGRREKLVINLSVGWTPADASDGAADAAIPSSIALLPILRARCNGAIVVAAAGNAATPSASALAPSSGAPSSDGPLLPAAWNRVALSQKLCERVAAAAPFAPDRGATPRAGSPSFGRSASDAGAAAARGKDGAALQGPQSAGATPGRSPEIGEPIVYAAGGVDALERPLATTRRGGRPPLAAYAHGVALRDADPALGAGAPPLSGSSIAAAAVSGVVAAVWAADVGQSAASVMHRIYDTGVPIGATADFPGDKPPCVRRVSLALALAGARSEPAATPCGLPAGDALPSLRALPEIAAGRPTFAVPDEGAMPCAIGAMCMPSVASSPTTKPWCGPQPSSPGCPTCNLRVERNGTVVIDAVLSPEATRAAMWLTVFDPAGPLQARLLHTTQSFTAPLRGVSKDAARAPASVSFVYDEIPDPATGMPTVTTEPLLPPSDGP